MKNTDPIAAAARAFRALCTVTVLLLAGCPDPATPRGDQGQDQEQVAAPAIQPSGGTFSDAQTVSIYTSTNGANIRYTLDGGTPSSTAGTLYSGPFSLSATGQVKAIAYQEGMKPSDVVTVSFTISTPPGAVAPPAFTPAAGTYEGTQSVEITSATSGASIRYATDGMPTPSRVEGTLYSGPVTVETTQTIRAIAYKIGMTDSSVISSKLTIRVVTPVITPAAGTYYEDQTVTITGDPGAAIYYTTNGLTPTIYSSLYGSPFPVTGTASGKATSVKALAVKTGCTNSTVASNALTVAYCPAQWARTTTSGSAESVFQAVTSDSAGNVYAAGYLKGTTSYGFGNGVTAQGKSSGSNLVLVKYDSSGSAQWASTIASGTSETQFHAVVVDSHGSIYAAGFLSGNAQIGLGNSITAQGVSTDLNGLLVKYDSGGSATWARTTTSGTGYTYFSGLAVDSADTVYAVGTVNGTTDVGFGNSITAKGASTTNLLVVGYGSSGDALWARSVTSGSDTSEFYGVTVDSSDNVIAVGQIYNTGAFGLGNGKSVQAAYNGWNAVVVKYNSSGDAQWAKAGYQRYIGVSTDGAGNVYAAGFTVGTSSHDYQDGISASGVFGGVSTILVKYSAGGTTQWAKSLDSASGESQLNSLAVDSSGAIYAVGMVGGATYTFAPGITISNAASGSSAIVVAKYRTDGVVQWAESLSNSPYNSDYYGVSLNPAGYVLAAGYIYGTGTYSFGNSVQAAGTASTAFNMTVVKYRIK